MTRPRFPGRAAFDLHSISVDRCLWGAAIASCLAISVFMSLLISQVRRSDYALSEVRNFEEPALAISALMRDHSRAGMEAFQQAIERARAEIEESGPAISAVLGPTAAGRTAHLLTQLDTISERARLGADSPLAASELAPALLAYHTEVMALAADLNHEHIRTMWRLELGLRGGIVVIAIGSLVAAFSVARAARRAAQRQLRETEQSAVEIAAIADAAPVAIIVGDGAGRIASTNAASEGLFGHARGAVTGQPVALLLPDVSTPAAGESSPARATARRLDGTTFPAEYSVTRTPEHAGHNRFVYVIQDISERLRAEEERLQFQERLLVAQRNDALSTLVAGVAHDFNNMIASIRGSVEMAQRAPRRQDEWLGHALVAADRSAGLVRQLLQYSRPGTADQVAVDVVDLVNETMMLARETFDRRIELRCVVPATRPMTRGDRGQLQQVIMNLLVNARDAVTTRLDHADGDAASDYEPRVTLRVSPADPLSPVCKIEVADNGTGISEILRTRMFDPFFTTKGAGKGTGLGLSTSARIVSAHNGAIDVDSEVGAGSVFTVTLPTVSASTASPPEDETCHGAASRTPHEAAHGQRVLLADDEPVIREFAAVVLRNAGYEVVAVSDGAAALLAGESSHFDLLVLDGNMPHLSGWQVVRQLRSSRPDLPAVVMTGYVDLDQARDIDAVVLEKPFGLDQFRRAVAGALGEHAASHAPAGVAAETAAENATLAGSRATHRA